ncbi:MAG: LysR family transcriptional regulator [Gammaproteobacteria bacterium]|nr:MAG: LysR family transcriptional regulator [Gammaproteobacteria bacterium]
MDIELLKTFLEVSKTRHFGKAAENLFLTQAAVSSRVKQLESIVDTPLFSRLRNNIQLTPAGEKLTRHAADILLKWESARLELARHNDGKTRMIIGATAGLWSLLLQKSLDFIYRNSPNHLLKTEIDSDTALLKKLQANQVDIAFIFEKPDAENLAFREFMSFDIALTTTLPPTDFNELINNRYIHINWGKNFQVWHLENFSEISPPIIETSLADIALEFILQNSGSAFLPFDLLQPELQQQVSLVDSPKFTQSIYVIYNRHNQKAELLRDIIDSLQPKIESIQPQVDYPVQM